MPVVPKPRRPPQRPVVVQYQRGRFLLDRLFGLHRHHHRFVPKDIWTFLQRRPRQGRFQDHFHSQYKPAQHDGRPHRRSRRPIEVKGVYNGQYYRMKLLSVPTLQSPALRNNAMSRLFPKVIPEIPFTFASPFCAYQPVYPRHRRFGKQQKQETFDFYEFLWLCRQWWKQNWSTVLMNMGAICTLIGFTRSDVLELRTFSLTGNVAALLYNMTQQPIRWPTALWTSIFASVNSFKIVEILDERQASVQLNPQQEDIYSKFFMPHGMTPKQFQLLHRKAQVLHISKGDCLIRKGDAFTHVYLIVDGWTRANISGRYLTAISFSADHFETKQGGASGAWVGEMAFLEYYFQKTAFNNKEKEKNETCNTTTTIDEPLDAKAESSATTTTTTVHTNAGKEDQQTTAAAAATGGGGGEAANDKTQANTASSASSSSSSSTAAPLTDSPTSEEDVFYFPTGPKEEALPPSSSSYPLPLQPQPTTHSHAMFSIVAKEDCTVLVWSHDDMSELMSRSTDMRASLTRAMTAAIVGKVINFTITTKTKHLPTWSTWIDDWKYSAGAKVKVLTPSTATTSLPATNGPTRVTVSPALVDDHKNKNNNADTPVTS